MVKGHSQWWGWGVPGRQMLNSALPPPPGCQRAPHSLTPTPSPSRTGREDRMEGGGRFWHRGLVGGPRSEMEPGGGSQVACTPRVS